MTARVQTIELDPKLDVLRTLSGFDDSPHLILLDSAVRQRERDARYTILSADPVEVVRFPTVQYGDKPFALLREWQNRMPTILPDDQPGLPPFFGGIAGLMSYELGHAFERLPESRSDDFRTPAMLAGLFDWAIVWDHLLGVVRAYVLQMNTDSDGSVALRRCAWLQRRLNGEAAEDTIVPKRKDHYSPLTVNVQSLHRVEPTSEIYSNFTRDEYIRAVRRVIEYIRAGDIFQANLSQRMMARWTGSATQLYARIRRHNPAPFCGLFKTEDFAVISASPERFLKVSRQRSVETRPIKGTRRRPLSPIADLYAGTELSTSEKDRAENVMIVDLLRNDISRSCKAGSVKVTGLCEVERFETVLHLVSTVAGDLRDDCDSWDLMAGCFPGGSITGAPKIRAMQIIAELEPTVRGAYCGSFFSLGPCGDFDSSILIRTFTLKDGWVQFPVGGGIVADSDPLEEYRETLHKASGMIRSLRLDEQ